MLNTYDKAKLRSQDNLFLSEKYWTFYGAGLSFWPFLLMIPVVETSTEQEMASETPDLEKLRSEMMARTFPLLFDDLVPRQGYLLNATLCDYLPASNDARPYAKPRLPSTAEPTLLPPAHHLVYFPPNMPDSLTLPDGTDPNQSPGKPFTRRMWAGGEVEFNNAKGSRLSLDGSRVACVERVADLAIKGHPGSEKLFVRMERLIGSCTSTESEDAIRNRLESGVDVAIKEVRNIFFSRPLSPEDKSKGLKPMKRKYFTPTSKESTKSSPLAQHTAAFSHVFQPNAKLLFRYSALTFNTHAIHRDIKFCHEVEQYPELIVHGPLSFTFLTTFLRHHLAKNSPSTHVAIKEIKYRNTHPLYNEQPIKLCGCQVESDRYELWEETPQGNVAVTYSATTEEVANDESPQVLYQDLGEYGIE